MGVTDRDPPFFFTKVRDAIVYCAPGATVEIPYPPETSNYHHEIELVVAIGKEGANISKADAASHIFGYAIGLDMTRRDLQSQAKDKGRPWDNGKSFQYSAPMGEIVPIQKTGEIVDGRIALSVNGTIRQDAPMDEMIWSVSETIEDLSRFHTLYPGDLILTGTPAGVGPVVVGDFLEGSAENVGTLRVKIV
jgi:fumarylpyruvate hydrolase